MNPSKSRYELHRRGKQFVVYRMEYDETGDMGFPVYHTFDFEEARKELYRLNGWKYKPKEK